MNSSSWILRYSACKCCSYMMMIFLLTCCQYTLTPTAFVGTAQGHRPKVIRMTNTMHLTPNKAFLDSTKLVYRVVDSIMASADNQLQIVVYFSGSGSWDYRRARAAGLSLEDLLVEHGYKESRITYEAKAVALDSTLRYPYRMIDFIVIHRRNFVTD